MLYGYVYFTHTVRWVDGIDVFWNFPRHPCASLPIFHFLLYSLLSVLLFLQNIYCYYLAAVSSCMHTTLTLWLNKSQHIPTLILIFFSQFFISTTCAISLVTTLSVISSSNYFPSSSVLCKILTIFSTKFGCSNWWKEIFTDYWNGRIYHILPRLCDF